MPTPLSEVTLNSVKYSVRGGVQRRQMNDAPRFVPTSGAQDAKGRSSHNVVSVKDIKNDFAHQVELRFEEHGGVLNHLADSNIDTRWGPLYAAPNENNPSNPAATGLSLFAPAESTVAGTRTGAITTANMNPKMPKYYEGSTNKNVFCLRIDDSASGGAGTEVELQRWGGTSWANISDLMAPSADANTGAYDLEQFQANLCALFNNGGTEQVYYTANGSSTVAFTNMPSVNAAQGSRLKVFGNLLWLFAYSGGTITVQEQTSPTGGAAWTTRGGASSLTGQLRDVDIFIDPSGTAARVFVLTETALYYWNETAYTWTQVMTLPYRGRAIIPFRVGGKPALLVFMDGMRVYAYYSDRSSDDISPGGLQGMPSGKDFGLQSSGQVCVTASGAGVYALWSGTNNGGTVLNPLCLVFDGSIETRDGRIVSAGWHFIWRKGDTSISAAARYIFIDPQSQDLVLGIQDATAEATTHVRLQDIEVSPEIQSTLDRSSAAQTFLTPRLDFSLPMVSTTVWDIFANTSGLGTSKSLAHAFRINGSTGAYTTIATVTTDNTLVTLPDNSATAAGTNFRDIQFQWTLDPNVVTDNIKIISLDIGYARVWPVRWLYVVDIDVGASIRMNRYREDKSSLITDITTLLGVATKVTLAYADVSTLVFPIQETEVSESIIASLQPTSGAGQRDGVWRVFLLEA